MEYQKGKVYLQDKRSKQIYLYEALLAKNPNFVPVVPNKADAAPNVNRESFAKRLEAEAEKLIDDAEKIAAGQNEVSK